MIEIPERIRRLEELANNLWWSWHDQARRLFRALDYPLWRLGGHNPVKELREVSPDRLQEAANDPAFLELYDSVMAAFDNDVKTPNKWVSANYPGLAGDPVGYFSMEYAIHNSLPIYAGGLGILAGDICKEASDLGLPMVAIGFMYPQGYFHQHVSLDGWQQELYQELNFDEAPISRVFSPGGGVSLATVELENVPVSIGVWQVKVGRTNIYLLDTNIEGNPSQYRQLSARLYIADRELRVQQEIVLGIGGVRVLRALNISPRVWHGNEGHTAFMMLERVREEIAQGVSLTEAQRRVQAATVFTTHTPVAAGHDVFPTELVDKYLRNYWKSFGADRGSIYEMGRQDGAGFPAFNMTAFALRMANGRSAVSQLHEKVTHRMWHNLWPDVSEDRVPISHVTNGVHLPTWLSAEMNYLFERYLGKDWLTRHDDGKIWERLREIPDDELWAIRQRQKRHLVGAIRERIRSRWLETDIPWGQQMAMGAVLDPEALTIGFVRRFTEYKRPTLVFQDIERLKKIVNNQWHPVQVVFAGKSHPSDFESKHLLQQVYSQAVTRDFQGRIVFVEDYDMHMAHYLVHGVDVWLNTPRRLQEACGTSGMKASLNGALHLSIPDGWWHEGYNGRNGWTIGSDTDGLQLAGGDETDAEALYRLLEEEVVPLYYKRSVSGVPNEWVALIKESISSIAPQFCSRRMLKEYVSGLYKPAAGI